MVGDVCPARRQFHDTKESLGNTVLVHTLVSTVFLSADARMVTVVNIHYVPQLSAD